MMETVTPSSSVGLVLLASGTTEMIRAAVAAHSEAAAALENNGVATTAVVVDRTTNSEANGLVHSLAEVTVVRVDPGEPDASAYVRGVEHLPPSARHVLLSATDASPGVHALESLLETALTADADLVLASAAQPAPYALLHRRAAGTLAEVALSASRPPVLALAKVLRAADRTVVTADDAGCAFNPEREILLAESARGAHLHVARPDAVSIGYATYFGPRTVIGTWGPLELIEIGSYCSFAWDVRALHPGAPAIDVSTGEPSTQVFRGSHLINSPTTYPIGTLVPDEPYDVMTLDGTLVGTPMVIGSDVWVGSNALLLGAITVGHGAVIGAGCVVTKDVGPYEVVVGNPATVRRRRFDDRTCQRLLAIRWWDWEPAIVRGNHRRFTLPTPEFLDRFDPAGSLGL